MFGVYLKCIYKHKSQTKQNDLHKIEGLNCLIFYCIEKHIVQKSDVGREKKYIRRRNWLKNAFIKR